MTHSLFMAATPIPTTNTPILPPPGPTTSYTSPSPPPPSTQTHHHGSMLEAPLTPPYHKVPPSPGTPSPPSPPPSVSSSAATPAPTPTKSSSPNPTPLFSSTHTTVSHRAGRTNRTDGRASLNAGCDILRARRGVRSGSWVARGRMGR